MTDQKVTDQQAKSDIWPVIVAWGKGQQPSLDDHHKIATQAFEHQRQAKAWEFETVEAAAVAVQTRATLLQNIAHTDDELPLPGSWCDWIEPLWRFWLPFAQQLNQQQRAQNAPFIQGILGGQGTGKTTLARMLCLILGHLGQRAASLSIDDLYLTYAERLKRQQQDPRLIWRGPPGTHDTALGVQILQQVKTSLPGHELSLPQFDKLLHHGQGDRTHPLIIPAPTILLFEGWFVGAQPIETALFTDLSNPLPPPLITEQDRQFAADCNDRLRDYLPLWHQLDSLIVLHPENYQFSKQWRQQAEQALKQKASLQTGKSVTGGLSNLEIDAFVTYFWKALHPDLFIEPLTKAVTTHLVVQIAGDHSINEVYSPITGHPDPL
ncbi:MAG: glycerate kinase [Cyanobacteria bacterium J06597_16]